ncbi:MAG: hypothetical protein IJT36_01755 [Alphaproteobacteria bacterium]|nr:hypothetical protein [Alphaproteobacteria bacterium]
MNIIIKSTKELIDTIKSMNIKRLYVASPLSAKSKTGIVANMLIARDKCNYLNGILKNSTKAWCPHGYLPQFLDDDIAEERKLGVDFGIRLLEMSDAIYVFGEKLSTGMKEEIKLAIKHRMPILIEDNLADEVKKYIGYVTQTGRI